MEKQFKKSMELWAIENQGKFIRIVEEIISKRVEAYDALTVRVIRKGTDWSLIMVKMMHEVILVRLLGQDDQTLMGNALKDMTAMIDELKATKAFENIETMTCLNIIQEKSKVDCQRCIQMKIDREFLGEKPLNVAIVLFEIDGIMNRIEDLGAEINDLYRLSMILKTNQFIQEGLLKHDSKYKDLYMFYHRS